MASVSLNPFRDIADLFKKQVDDFDVMFKDLHKSLEGSPGTAVKKTVTIEKSENGVVTKTVTVYEVQKRKDV